MRYWWVNQNQTFNQETRGGYLWSPKLRSDGAHLHYYETMREVAPGDIVFSFVGRFIRAIGIAKSYCYECPKPAEFGSVGFNWSITGWKVDVNYIFPKRQIRPKDHMEIIGPILPAKYSPLQKSGDGIQAYLMEISQEFAEVLAGLIGNEANFVIAGHSEVVADLFATAASGTGVEEWENHLQANIEDDRKLKDTQKTALIFARRGQGLFKDRVMRRENHCRVTKVENPIHLIGSHIKPWRDCKGNEERLDGENGLLLTPSIDHLFDRGFISFNGNGDLLISPRADKVSLRRMGVETENFVNVGGFSTNQSRYLEYHRDLIFLKSQA